MSHFVLNVELIISNQCKLNFFFFIENILFIFFKFFNKGLAVGPMTKLIEASGYVFCKYLNTPVDKTVSPTKLEQIINIFTKNSCQN